LEKKHAFSFALSLYVRAVAETSGERQAKRLHESNETFIAVLRYWRAIATIAHEVKSGRNVNVAKARSGNSTESKSVLGFRGAKPSHFLISPFNNTPSQEKTFNEAWKM
jgi:hypothetical protein